MQGNPEVRYAGPVDADTDGKRLRVIATVLEKPYDVYTLDGKFEEVMARNVFTDSLSRRSHAIPLLVNHDRTKPGIGRAIEWTKDDNHLYATYELGKSPEAVGVAQQIADGGFGGVSVSFIPLKERWSKDRTQVRRETARLLELSLATVPANAEHEILELRNLITVASSPPALVATPGLDEARRRLEAIQASRIIL